MIQEGQGRLCAAGAEEGGNARLRRPLSFGPGQRCTIQGRVGLAPLAGVSEQVFRVMASEQGAAITTTELTSARGIAYSGLESSRRYLAVDPREGPVLLQLFGADPEDLAEAITQILSDPSFTPPELPILGFDLNMGCPVEKVVKTGAGSALMREPARAAAILRRMRQAVDAAGRPELAVTVKLRLGFAAGELSAPALVPLLMDAGVDLIAVHGRTRAQMYRGAASREGIRATVEAVRRHEAVIGRSVPVLGNGDVTGWREAVSMMEETGADGVLIGRAAEGHPWIFRLDDEEPQLATRIAMARRHGYGLAETLGESLAMREFRKTLMKYLSGTRGAAALRAEASQIASLEGLEAFLGKWEATPTA